MVTARIRICRRPPLGEHTDDVLAGLSLDGAEVDRLRSAGVIG